LVTPVTVTPETSAVGRLKALGIEEREVGHVILSHFHADHIGGAGDFSRARMVYSSRELGELLSLGKFQQVKHGFLKALLPDDLHSRSIPADHFPVPLPELGPDWSGMDLLGDSSLFLVPLPGHTLGQIGLYAPGVSGQDYLLVADAAWLTPSFEENINPMAVTDLIFHDGNEYRRTLGRLHELHCRKKADGRLRILTCHCETAFKRIREESSR
jgi:glyoxylase-like metal-dependent hydrolase (beta-lactamase superfamily II)